MSILSKMMAKFASRAVFPRAFREVVESEPTKGPFAGHYSQDSKKSLKRR
jgi:hypothetical protein